MRYFLFILLLIIISCAQKIKKKSVEKTSEITIANPQQARLDSLDRVSAYRSNRAMLLADSIFYYVEQWDTKKMTKKQVNRMANPMQHELDSLKALMTDYERYSVDTYRSKLVNELVDRKVERDRAKK